MDNRYDGLLWELCEKGYGFQRTQGNPRPGRIVAERSVGGVKYTSSLEVCGVSHFYPAGNERKRSPAGFIAEIADQDGKVIYSTFVPAARHPSKVAGRVFEACLAATLQEAKHIYEGSEKNSALACFMIDRFLDSSGNRVEDYAKWAPEPMEVDYDPETAFLDYAKKSFKGMYGHHMPLHSRPEVGKTASADRLMDTLVEKWIGSRFADSTPRECEIPVGYETFENLVDDEFTVGIGALVSPEAIADYPLRDVECITVVLGSSMYNNPDYNTSQMFFDDPSKSSTWFQAAIASAIFEAQRCPTKQEAIGVLTDLIASDSTEYVGVQFPEDIEPLPCDPSRVEQDFSAWKPLVEDIFNQAHPGYRLDEICPEFNDAAPSFKP